MARKRGAPVRRAGCFLLLIVGLAALGYGGNAKLQLDRALAARDKTIYPGDGDAAKRAAIRRSVGYRVAFRSESPVPTSLPIALEAVAKREDAVENWLPDAARGLVEMRLFWIPSRWDWVEDAAPRLPDAEKLKLQGLAVAGIPGPLIDALADPDRNRRQVADQALRLETGQDFGYRFDRDPASQKEAIDAWKAWWDKNKLQWGAGKIGGGIGGKIGEIIKGVGGAATPRS